MGMIWHIKQCRHCPEHDDCDYKQSLKEVTKNMEPIHVSHNCRKYKTLFQIGQRVEIEVNYREPDDERGSVWESYGFVTGAITGIIYRKNFWEVQLDKPVTLTRYKHGQMSDSVFINYIKPANKIKVIEGEFSDIKRVDFGEFDSPDIW